MQSPDHFKYLAGWEVDSTKDLPEGFTTWEVPATSYAVLQCNDVADIDRVLSYFYGQWSQVSPDWESAGGYMAECYLASYPEDHQIYLHLPVKPRQAPRQAIEGRLVLEGVPRIGFHRHLSPTPGSVYALLEYLGETPAYDYLMGASGAAFRRACEKMDGGNIDLMRYGMAPFKRLFEALAFDYTITGWQSRQAVLDVIKTSLAAGRPALAFGIVGPPECGLVTGYLRDGEALIGWSYFQEPDSPGYYEQSDWFEQAPKQEAAVMTLGARVPRPAPREVVASSLKWAVELARMPVLPDHPDHSAGLSAYEAWAAGLEADEDFPAGNDEALAYRVMIHGDQCVMLAERRNAAGFLRWAAEVLPEVETELLAAADLYHQAADDCAGLWPWGMDMDDPVIKRDLVNREFRLSLAAHIRAISLKEAEAVALLEQALTRLKG